MSKIVGEEDSDELMSGIQRLERLSEEKSEITDQEKEVKAELKAQGFDLKVVAEILKLRKQDPDDRSEFETLLDLYKNVVGLA